MLCSADSTVLKTARIPRKAFSMGPDTTNVRKPQSSSRQGSSSWPILHPDSIVISLIVEPFFPITAPMTLYISGMRITYRGMRLRTQSWRLSRQRWLPTIDTSRPPPLLPPLGILLGAGRPQEKPCPGCSRPRGGPSVTRRCGGPGGPRGAPWGPGPRSAPLVGVRPRGLPLAGDRKGGRPGPRLFRAILDSSNREALAGAGSRG
eukprot:scaffold1638_cov258-Pinguiococcus_pyrenoidosus.AAC.23